MRKINKQKKAAILTKEDLYANVENKEVSLFLKMLNENSYAFRVKRHLYSVGKLSAKGFLYNEDILNLKLGKKSSEGVILIDEGILAILDRFVFASRVRDKGDALTAFLIDNDDKFFEQLLKNTNAEVKLEGEEYVNLFDEAYTRISSSVLKNQINTLLQTDLKLKSVIDEEIDLNED